MIWLSISLHFFILQITLAVVQASNSDKENYFLKKSYDEVTALVDKHFNSKCNLLLQNCIFQNQWERLFGHDKVFLDSSSSSSNHNSNDHYSHNKRNTRLNFFHCQAFIVARFCIDDYLKKTYSDNYECLNGTNGNMPQQFKDTIYRNDCKKYYQHFFINNNFVARNLFSSNANSSNNKYSFFKILLLLFIIVFIF